MLTAAAQTLRQRARRLHGDLDGSRWEMAVRPPAAPLRPYVRGDYVGYTEWSGPMNRRREFPGPFVVMILEFGPPLRVYEAGDPRRLSRHRGGFVVGLGDAFAVCEHDGFQQGVQVNLTAIGARLLFGLPMSELSGRTVSVRDVLPARHRDLGQRLQDAADWDARFDLLDAALADSMSEARDRTRIVSWAVRRIEQTGGGLDMRALARELGYSRKHVITLFCDQVGIPPKLLARLVRFDRLVRHLRHGGPGTWAELAVEFGYYDQAHLVRDVRWFTGITPTEVRPMAADPLGQLC
jgi:AraC-like DNA-binding protein